MQTDDPSAHVVFLLAPDGRIAAWNSAAASLCALTPAQALGQSLTTLFAPPPAEPSADWDALCAMHGRPTLVYLHQHDASRIQAALTLAPQRALDGRTLGWVATLRRTHEAAVATAALVGLMPLASIIDVLPGSFYALNRAGRFVFWNRQHERIAELSSEEMAATNATELVELGNRQLVTDTIARVFDHDANVELELDLIGRSGRVTPMLLRGTRIGWHGEDYLFGMGIDISAWRKQETTLRLRERALHAAGNGILISAIEGNKCPINYVNPAFERITGYSAADVIGRDPCFMSAPGMDEHEHALLHAAILAHQALNVVLRNRRKDGELFWNDLSITPVQDEHGVTTHFIGVIQDVTASRLRTDHLEHEVNHDPLTGLANRNLMWDRLDQALHLSQRQQSQVGVVLIDLNNFKLINDNFGHEAGDVVLKAAARRLLASVREVDTVARLSGDEFVLVLVNQPSLRFTLSMIERLRKNLIQPVNFMHKEIVVGASIGVALYPHDGANAVDLIRAADVAMYHAKATGRDEIYFFSPDMKSSSDARQLLDASMAHAIGRAELFMLYQPCIDTASGRVRSFEALLRWRHPERGVLLPSAFLAEATENGRIVAFGAWALDQACAFLHELHTLGVHDIPVSVNVSAREYGQADFLAGIAARLLAYGLAPANLQIEVRADALQHNPQQLRALASGLHLLGVTLSIDEFGQGMSDLGFLNELAVGQLKLSQAAVHAITEDTSDGDAGSTMARTLIEIGHNLHLPVIGEAVETRAQRDFLTAHGCSTLQGRLFNEPLAAAAARDLVRAQAVH